MTRPGRYLIRMLLFVVAVLAVAALLFPSLIQAFYTNPLLNGLILGVLILGIIYNLRQVLLLGPEVRWIEHFRGEREDIAGPEEPRLLAPMATMLSTRKGTLTLSAPAMRSLLDGISSRLDESRDLSRYTIGLLVFLGLLGTFWGLLQTVSSIGGVIRGLSLEGSDFSAVFATLKAGLEAPMAGMGTAFSTSLFGLAGSLVLGFLDLQAGQAQNRFFTELEDWLSGVTRLSSGSLSGDGEHAVPVYVQALLEQTAESLEALQRTLTRAEESRIASHAQFLALAERVGTLTEQMRSEQSVLLRLAEGQSELKPLLARLGEAIAASGKGGIDDATRAHIRNLEVYVSRLLDEMANGREELIRQVRSDIKLLARTIAAVNEDGTRPSR
jgi:hypothetical protein